MTLQLGSLLSAPGGRSLPVRAEPRWPRFRDSKRRKQNLVEVSAEDDRGVPYLCRFGGVSFGRNGYEELRLEFMPRLDPLARRLRLMCTGSSEQIAIDLDLAPGTLGRGRPRSAGGFASQPKVVALQEVNANLQEIDS